MLKTDISKFGDVSDIKFRKKNKRFSFARGMRVILVLFFRLAVSMVLIMVFTSTAVIFLLNTYISTLSDEEFSPDINASKLAMTSFVYVNDENGVPQEYQRIYNLENRIWVPYEEIPRHMIDAIIAIEDKRFYTHKGVDWRRTASAVMCWIRGSEETHGGSTLTQQLVKNLTDDKDVSITRKLREIVRALNLEKKYSKDEIVEAYLNVVNFGAGSRGVQAAANIYFGRDINQCSLAQCASIAAITQNPSAYNPLYHPGKNKERAEVVIREMHFQNKISEQDFIFTMEELENLQFASGPSDTNTEVKRSTDGIRNWYIEAVLRDVISDLCNKYKIGKSSAENMLFTQGLKIYCAMETHAQEIVEATLRNSEIMPKDSKIELGYVLMGYDGRILASIGSRKKKVGNLLYDRANAAKRQPGSVIKPLAAYTPAIDMGIYNYSSLIPDLPLKIDADGRGTVRDWPNNWYGGYRGNILLRWAIEKSANAPPAQLVNMMGTGKVYEFLTKKLGLTSLDNNDSHSLSALATGGTHRGVTVRELTAAFQIFGNSGRYYTPYTYFYVTDRNNKVILDNRSAVPIQAVSASTATIMNRLLRNVIAGAEGTGRSAGIGNWNIIGKTGTTTDDFDSWFVGLSPYAVGGIWTGYDSPKRIRETSAAIRIWKHIMSAYLKNKKLIDYDYDKKVLEANYCVETGLLANSNCPDIAKGYYLGSAVPQNCTKHGGSPTEEIEKTLEEIESNENIENKEQTEEQKDEKQHIEMENDLLRVGG
jgi:penicillin-binding protein 1A